MPLVFTCSFWFRKWRIWIILLITLLWVIASPVYAQADNTTGNAVDGYPVVLNGQELFRIKQGIPGAASAAERAKLINERLVKVANDAAISPDEIQVENTGNESIVKAGETVLLTIRSVDQVEGISHQDLANQAVQLIRPAILEYRQERSLERRVQGIILAILSTLGLFLFLLLLQRFSSKLLTRIRLARQANTLEFRIQNFQILGSDATSYLLSSLLKLLRLALVVLSFYLYLPFLLSQFPATQALGKSIFNDIAYRINQITNAFVQYLPNLVTIAVIVLFTYYLIQFAKLVIVELGRDDAYPWFYPEWIAPTIRLASILLVAIGCIIAAPYLPGFNSPAFQGVSLFLGALLTLGSSSAVSNAIAGIILIYTRAFRIGDMVRIGEMLGEVVEKSLFVTRILTPKKEVITLPNASVLSGNVVNYSAIARESKSHLLLHTTITLGYDIPWRKIHDVLIEAAKATEYIVTDPQPFVLQTSLNDFHVSYELNAYTRHPRLMPRIYSDLHQNIQDYCNQAGIEILSPAFSALRDGNHSTIPANYLPQDYQAPRFQIQQQVDTNHKSAQ